MYVVLSSPFPMKSLVFFPGARHFGHFRGWSWFILQICPGPASTTASPQALSWPLSSACGKTWEKAGQCTRCTSQIQSDEHLLNLMLLKPVPCHAALQSSSHRQSLCISVICFLYMFHIFHISPRFLQHLPTSKGGKACNGPWDVHHP